MVQTSRSKPRFDTDRSMECTYTQVSDLHNCKLCDLNEIRDEFHYILKCQFFASNRKKLFNNDKKRINCVLMKELFNSECMKNLKELATFINELISNFNTHNLVK